jgi:hypothetical protein
MMQVKENDGVIVSYWISTDYAINPAVVKTTSPNARSQPGKPKPKMLTMREHVTDRARF